MIRKDTDCSPDQTRVFGVLSPDGAVYTLWLSVHLIVACSLIRCVDWLPSLLYSSTAECLFRR